MHENNVCGGIVEIHLKYFLKCDLFIALSQSHFVKMPISGQNTNLPNENLWYMEFQNFNFNNFSSLLIISLICNKKEIS